MAALNRGSARKTPEPVATDMRYGTTLGPKVDITDGDYEHLKGAGVVLITAGVNEKTPLIDASQSSSLKVDLKPGTYDLYCSVPGHKEAGMDLKLKVT